MVEGPNIPDPDADLAQVSYTEDMATDEYHEALLERVHGLQNEIRSLSHREAVSFAYLMSRDLPEEALRMLTAELLLDYWSRMRRGSSASTDGTRAAG
jgi:hypothetical protein